MKKWLKITGFENYEVSNLGNVRSLDWEIKVPTGQTGVKKGKVLKPYLDKKGYLNCDLRNGKKRKCAKVHRLVAEAFISNPQNKPQINHKNGIKTDNRVENLEWCTNGENQIHAFKNGLNKGNFEHPNSKLSLEQVLYIKNNCVLGSKTNGVQTLAKKFGVCSATIKQIIDGKSYRSVE